MLVGCATARVAVPVRGHDRLHASSARRSTSTTCACASSRCRPPRRGSLQLDYELCPHCDYEVEYDYLRCPSCLRKLKDPATCGKPLDPAWKMCPYCEAETAVARARRLERPPAPARHRQRRPSDAGRTSASPRPVALTIPDPRRPMARTLILVKPDAFARNLTGEIIARFERKGLRIAALRHMTVDRGPPSSTTRSTTASRSSASSSSSSPPARWSRWCSRARTRSRPPAR